jgi:two-component system LytT family response regulator
MEDCVLIKVSSRLMKLDTIKILYIEALADYITIYTEDGKYTVLSTMKNVESMLSDDFFRVHNSFIVNLNHITFIENSNLYINSIQIPISRNKAKTLMSRFKIIK